MPFRPTPPPETPLWATLKDSYSQTRAGMPHGWRAQARQTTEDLEAFYLSDSQRADLSERRPVWRWVLRAWWLAKALFFRLTPARRVLLVAALLLVVVGRQPLVSVGGNLNAGLDLILLGTAVLLVLLMLELKDKLLARYELEAGRAVQQALMPDEPPRVPGWDVWLYSRPANDVGGDLVDHLQVNGRTRLVLADVAGKALPAALLMAKVQATLRALATEVPELPALAARTNTILCRDGLPNRFATMVYLEIDGRSGHVTLVNAGHQPPLVITPAGHHELPHGGMALGLMPGSSYAEQAATLDPGAVLLVYSDGVTEAMNDAGTFFGEERLLALVPALSGLTSEQAGRRILASVDAFVGQRRPHDDLSLIVLKRQEPSV